MSELVRPSVEVVTQERKPDPRGIELMLAAEVILQSPDALVVAGPQNTRNLCVAHRRKPEQKIEVHAKLASERVYGVRPLMAGITLSDSDGHVYMHLERRRLPACNLVDDPFAEYIFTELQSHLSE
jgi:hypothetical protein